MFLIYKYASSVLIFLLNLLIAKYLDIEDFGYFAYLNSICILITTFFYVGLEKFTLKEFNQGRVNHAISKLNKYFFITILVVVLLSAFFNKSNLFLLLFLSNSLNWYIGILFIFFQIDSKAKLGELRLSLIRNIFILGVLIYSFVVLKIFKPEVIPYTMISITFLIILFNYSKLLKISSKYSDTFIFKFKELLIFSIIALGAIINNQVDLIMINNLLGNQDTALYRLAVLFLSMILILEKSFHTLLTPKIKNINKNNILNYQEDVNIFGRRAFLIALFAFFIMLIIGKPIINFLYDGTFDQSIQLIYILIAGQLVSMVFGFSGFILTMINDTKFIAIIVYVCALLNILLNYLLIIEFGVIGAAYASSFVLILKAFLLYKYTKKKLNMSTFIFNYEN